MRGVEDPSEGLGDGRLGGDISPLREATVADFTSTVNAPGRGRRSVLRERAQGAPDRPPVGHRWSQRAIQTLKATSSRPRQIQLDTQTGKGSFVLNEHSEDAPLPTETLLVD